MKYLFLLTSSLCLGVPAWAEEAPDPDDDIVVLASGFEEQRIKTGQAISVVTRERLDQLQSTTVMDALRTLPGVSVAKRGTIGGQSSVFIRGANSSQTLVLIDGVRVNDPSSPNAAFDFGPLLVGNAHRVELLRGPNSIVWGSQAIGGVVDVEMRKPEGPLEIDADLEYGSNDTVSGSANLSGTAGILEAGLGGSFFRTDGISSLTGGSELDGSRLYALNGRVKVNLAPSLRLDFRGYFNDSRIAYDSPFSGGANSLPVAYNRQFVAYAGASFELADGRFRSRLAYTRTDIDRRGIDPVVFSFNNYIVSGTIDRIEYRGAYDLAGFLTLTVGAEHEKTHSGTSFEGAPADLADNSVTSGYAQVTLRPLNGLTLTGGVRYDFYTDYGDHWALGGNVAYTPNDGATVLRATYSEGFRAPTLTEGQPPFGNPALKPETARNLDLGIEQKLFDDRLRLSATWFHRRSNDLIAFSFVTFQSENIDKVDSDGLELTLAADPTPTLHVEGSYSLTNAFNRSGANSGKRLQLRPQHSGGLTVDWETPLKLKLGGTLTVTGDGFDDAANLVRLDGFTLVDLRASYPLTERVELYGRIENLFDEKPDRVGLRDFRPFGFCRGEGAVLSAAALLRAATHFPATRRLRPGSARRSAPRPPHHRQPQPLHRRGPRRSRRPGQILAISHFSRDPRAHLDRGPASAALPRHRGTVEEVLALRPDVVDRRQLRPPAPTVPGVRAARLPARPLRHRDRPWPRTRRRCADLARLAGHPERGEALLARIDAALAAAAPPPGERVDPAVVWQGGRDRAGRAHADRRPAATHRLCQTSRRARAASGRPACRSRRMLADPPRVILAAGCRGEEDRMLRHPALRALRNVRARLALRAAVVRRARP